MGGKLHLKAKYLLGARQRWLGLGLKGARKVGAGPRVLFCYSFFSSWLGPDQDCLQGMPLVARVRPSGRLSNAVDCLQCSANAAGRLGGDLAPWP